MTTFTYNDNPAPTTPPSKTATTNGHWVRTSMDGFGRTIKTETGYSTTTVSTVDTVYLPCGCSPLGKMTKTSQPYAPGGTQYWTINTYDGSGRTVSTQAPDGSSTTTYVYRGNTVTVTDPAGKWKKFTMDAFGNLTSVVEPDPTYTTVTTNYSYDVMNHLIQVSMPRGGNPQVRSFNYTYSNGVTVPFLLSSTNPETGTVSYTYDTNGVMLTKTDAKNQVFTYDYDGYKRVKTISVGGNVIRNFYYDTNPLDGTFSQYTQGRLTAVLHAPFVAVPGTPQISHRFAEMYSYTQAGQPIKKRLQANENVYYDQTHNHTGTINLDARYTYDNEGKITSVNYPTTYGVDGDENLIPVTGPTYTYSFDNMSRPVGLTDQNNSTAVSNVTYGPANQLLTMNYFGVAETRTYNSMLQMTHLSIPGQVDITYTFPSATTNNGKISSQTDNISGETVSYLYDSLNRLSAASGSGWNQNFGYDGFGNLVSKTGTNSPPLSVAIDATTNRVVGQSYDANGNQQTTPTMSGYLGYDPENRLLSAPGLQFAYDVQNKRIWKGMFDGNGYLTGQELYFYGVDGQKLGTYTLMSDYGQNRQTVLWDPPATTAVFFGGKRVAVAGTAFVSDRLGSKGKYYPYGEERNSPPLANDQVKFATYTRDSGSGLDYADQRYYANTHGRFMSPDPYKASAGPRRPQSWNRYSYVEGDPVNHYDPSGLFIIFPDHCDVIEYWAPNFDGGGGKTISILVCTFVGPVDFNSNDVRPKEAPSPEDRINKNVSGNLLRAPTKALNALQKKKCLDAIFPGATVAPADVLANIANGSRYGYLQIDDIDPDSTNGLVNATTQGIFPVLTDIGNGAQRSDFTAGLITINSRGNFRGGSGSDLDTSRAITLIHELGHVFNLPGLQQLLGGSAIAADGPSIVNGKAISDDNSKKILENCF